MNNKVNSVKIFFVVGKILTSSTPLTQKLRLTTEMSKAEYSSFKKKKNKSCDVTEEVLFLFKFFANRNLRYNEIQQLPVGLFSNLPLLSVL